MNTNKLNAKTISIRKTLAHRQTNRQELLARIHIERREKRATQYYASRGLDFEEENAVQTRAQRMEEYKQKKLKQKQEEQKKKLPPFRAGIVRHTLDSPYKYYDKDKKEEVKVPTNKPFKFALKPRLPPAKITIPYSPKFSRIGGHKVCFEKPSVSALPGTEAQGIAPRTRESSRHPNPPCRTAVQATRVTRQTSQGSRDKNQMELKHGTSGQRKQAREVTLRDKTNDNAAASKKADMNNKTKLGLEQGREATKTNRSKASLEKTVDNQAASTSQKCQKTSVGNRTSPRNIITAEKSPWSSTPDERQTADVFQFKAVANRDEKMTGMETGLFTIVQETNANRNGVEDALRVVANNGSEPMETEGEGVSRNPSIEVQEAETAKENQEPNAIERDELNNSIDIPEFFVRRKSSKSCLRKNSLMTPSKEDQTSQSMSGVEFQRRRLNEERDILHRFCYLWYETLQAVPDIPADIRDEIDCILGQTKLLTSDKFQQMSRLIDQCEQQQTAGYSGAGPRILENDLDSFWDMMYIQVELMYKKFDRLKRLQRDGWADKEEEERKENEKRKQKGKTGSKTTSAKLGAKSRIADFIKSKRIAVKNDAAAATPDETKIFTGVFFKIESPVSQKRSTRASEPRLTPQVQKSILKNKMSSLNIVAVSPLAKTLAVTSLVDFISTPCNEPKSILKSNKTVGKAKTTTPGGKKICFSLSDPLDEEIFSTPRESPRKQIRKTPHKSRTPEMPTRKSPRFTPNRTADESSATTSAKFVLRPSRIKVDL